MITSRVLVYSTAYCGFCRRAEELLRRAGIAFETVDVTDDVAARVALAACAGGRRTVPVVFLDGEPIGGYQELAALLRAGELKHLSAVA